MTRDEHRRLTALLMPSVLAAGHMQMEYFTGGCDVQTKADHSPVTIADQRAEAMITARLGEVMAGVPVVAEEAFAAGQRWERAETFLLVDALDGTKQFITGHKEFTINIALVRSGRPVFGLIYAPALGALFVTDGPQSALHAAVPPMLETVQGLQDARPIRVKPHYGAVVALQSRSRNFDMTNKYLEGFPIGGRKQLGSSYKFCLIANGEADVYPQFGDTREWDTAAGEAVLLAAGGYVETRDGNPMRYGKTEGEYLNPNFIASSAPLDTLMGFENS